MSRRKTKISNESQDYSENLKEHLKNLLGNFVLKDAKPDTERISKYLSPANMLIWEQAFRDEFYDPDSNYEALETRGDFALKSAFTAYLNDRFDNLTPAHITQINSEYMSENCQIQLSKSLGFEKFIKAIEFREKMLEDVFESFCGALYKISMQEDSIGKAFTNMYNFIVYLMSKVAIDINKDNSAKNYVEQAFSMAKIRNDLNLKEVKHAKFNTFKYILTVSPRGVSTFKELGFNMPSILGQTDFGPKKEMEELVFDQGYKTLVSLGLTGDVARQIKEEREFIDTRFNQKKVQQAREKAVKMGYPRLYYRQTNNDDYSHTIYFMAQSPEGLKKLISWKKVPAHSSKDTDIKVSLLEEFAAS